MKRQGGFTLIEMVVVIVILGILAVTAAPRFLNLQDDARNSALQGLKGALDGAGGIVFGKAAIDGLERVDAAEAGEGKKPEAGDVKITFGYPTATSEGIGKAFVSDDWDAITTNENLAVTGDALKEGEIAYTFKGRATAGCYVLYKQADATTEAKTEVVVGNGCNNE